MTTLNTSRKRFGAFKRVSTDASSPRAADRPRSRFANEWTRSFVLALFVLLWFFLVPVPGLIVFTAGSYRFTIGLELLLTVLGSAIVLVLLSDLVARFFQWMDMRGFLRPGLYNRVQTCFERLRTMDPSNGPLTPAETASVFALLTDTQTYIDQRGYAYARRSLEIAEGMLRQASLRSRSAELAA